MRHRHATVTLDRKKAPREALLRHLAESAILYERIKTTRAKAKAAQSLVEELVRIGKTNSLNSRRTLLRTLATDGALRKVLEVLGPRYASRAGGCTRIVKIGRRQGDAAEIVSLEFI